jgi:hypothetical protein
MVYGWEYLCECGARACAVENWEGKYVPEPHYPPAPKAPKLQKDMKGRNTKR